MSSAVLRYNPVCLLRVMEDIEGTAMGKAAAAASPTETTAFLPMASPQHRHSQKGHVVLRYFARLTSGIILQRSHFRRSPGKAPKPSML